MKTIYYFAIGMLGFHGFCVSASPPEINEDVKSYARDMNISIDEALSRFKIEGGLKELTRFLNSELRHYFGGLFIQHKPDYSIVVLLTNLDYSDAISDFLLNNNKTWTNIVKFRKVDRTLYELENLRDKYHNKMHKSGISVNSALNIRNNTVEIYTEEDPNTLFFKFEEFKGGFPEGIEIIKKGPIKPLSDIHGGVSLSECTAGYSVILESA